MIIAIAGNIGAGKTTLANLIAKELKFDVEFEDDANNPYISDFYSDMNRWAFNMQVHLLINRLKQAIVLQRNDKNFVLDRTLYEDAEIFAPNLLGMGMMSLRDYTTYKGLFDSILQLVEPPDLIIYLKASISTLVERIDKRGRDYEDSIRIEYLRRLNDRYDEWYQSYNLGAKMEIETDDLNILENPEDFGKIVTRIRGEKFGLFH